MCSSDLSVTGTLSGNRRNGATTSTCCDFSGKTCITPISCVKEAEATLLTSKLSYLPSLFLAPEGAASSFDRGKATQTYSLPVTASWELDIFGKVTTAKRRAKDAYEQSKEYEQAVKTQLVASVANTYYTLLMLDSQYEIAVATEADRKSVV